MLRLAFDFIITWRETRTRPNAYSEIASSLGWSNKCRWAKISLMTLSCKEVTATMAQELEQPIYVKPNLIAENGKPFQGNLEYFFTLYCWFTERYCAWSGMVDACLYFISSSNFPNEVNVRCFPPQVRYKVSGAMTCRWGRPAGTFWVCRQVYPWRFSALIVQCNKVSSVASTVISCFPFTVG